MRKNQLFCYRQITVKLKISLFLAVTVVTAVTTNNGAACSVTIKKNQLVTSGNKLLKIPLKT
jgi:hypothetical protein